MEIPWAQESPVSLEVMDIIPAMYIIANPPPMAKVWLKTWYNKLECAKLSTEVTTVKLAVLVSFNPKYPVLTI